MSTIIMSHNVVKVTKYSRKLISVGAEKPFCATTLRVTDKDGVKTEITLFSDEELVIEDEQV